MSRSEFKKILTSSKKILMAARKKRIRPGLDDKILTSWNALMLKAYLQAYRALGSSKYLDRALRNYHFLAANLEKKDGGLYHTWKDSKASVNGFLEDYCFYIDALIELYQVTFDETFLEKAEMLTEYVITYFHNPENGFFYFTSSQDSGLIARKTEIHDNVIPSGNSAMATVLYKLGHLMDRTKYLEMAERMLSYVKQDMTKFPSAYSNWGILAMNTSLPHYNVAISGEEAPGKAEEIGNIYLPNVLLAVSQKPSDLPLLAGRFSGSETLIYVCSGKSCKLPVESVNEALKLIER
jgi:uncharacterized protein YyaL (SSP411 family)